MVTIMTDLQNRAKKLAQVQEWYSQQPMSLHVYGSRFGKNAYLALEHIAQTPDVALKCFEGGQAEPEISLLAMRERPSVLIDLTAIATIRLLRLEWIFATKQYRFAITQATWEELHDTLLDDKQPPGTRANISYTDNAYVWQEQDAAATEHLKLSWRASKRMFRFSRRLSLPKLRRKTATCWSNTLDRTAPRPSQ
jgi:hypothetical protein